MSVAHHGDEQEQYRLMQKLQEQIEGRRRREYPEGRISGDDEGELAYMIAADPEHGIVRIEFGKPVDWLGLPPQHAVDLAQQLIKHARAVSKEPLRVVLN